MDRAARLQIHALSSEVRCNYDTTETNKIGKRFEKSATQSFDSRTTDKKLGKAENGTVNGKGNSYLNYRQQRQTHEGSGDRMIMMRCQRFGGSDSGLFLNNVSAIM
jgi:hypothetical protein